MQVKTPTIARFAAGLRSGFPIFLGYLPVGFAFGILACQNGFTPLEAVACSAAGFSGVGQFVALSALLASGSVITALISSVIVNLRYVLFSASLSPYVSGVPLTHLLWQGYSVTDESFAINVAELREGSATPASMAGVGAVAWVGWIGGTAAGALGANYVGDLSRFGIDFAMPAMYAALFVALAQNRRHVLCGLGTAAFTLALYGANRLGLGLPSHWFIVVAALVGATVAVLVFKDSGTDVEETAEGDIASSVAGRIEGSECVQ